jgi:hypothetical protein
VALQIIIKDKTKYGKTRSEQEWNLRKDGFKGMDDDKYDKCKWLEKKLKDKTGASEGFINQADLHKVK